MAPQKEKILESAQRFIIRGQIDRAIRDYQQVIAMDPRDNRYRQKLAELLVRDGRQEEAVEQFEEIARNYSQNSYYLKAIAVYKQIQRLVPNDTRISLILAELNHKQGLVGNALAEYGQVVGALEREGSLKKVIEVLEQMISIDGQNLTTRLKYAEILRRTGDDERAYRAFGEILHALKLRGDVTGAQKFEQRLNLMYPQKGKPGEEGAASLNLEWGDADTKAAAAQSAVEQEPPAELQLSLEEEHHEPKGACAAAAHGPAAPVGADGPEFDLALDAEEHSPAPNPSTAPPAEKLPDFLQELPSPFPASAQEAGNAPAPGNGATPVERSQPYWEVDIELDFEEDEEESSDEGMEPSHAGGAASEAAAPIMPRRGEPLSVEEPEGLHQEDINLDWLDLVDLDSEGPVAVAPPEELRPAPVRASTAEEAPVAAEPADLADLVGLAAGAQAAAASPAVPAVSAAGATTKAEAPSLSWGDIFPEWSTPAADADLGELQSHYDLGLAYKEMGMLREAIKELSKAGRNPGRRIDSLIFQAMCYRELGEAGRAEELLEKGRALRDISVGERMWLGYELAELCEQTEKIEEAVELYQEIYDWDAGFQEVAVRLGRLTGEEIPAEIELAEEF